MGEIINKGLEELRELLSKELDDYGIDYKIEELEENLWEVNIIDESRGLDEYLRFKYDEAEVYSKISFEKIKVKKLFVDMYEYQWEIVDWCDSSVKYFWMALLDW